MHNPFSLHIIYMEACNIKLILITLTFNNFTGHDQYLGAKLYPCEILSSSIVTIGGIANTDSNTMYACMCLHFNK